MPRIANLIFAGVACVAVAMVFVVIGRTETRQETHQETHRDVHAAPAEAAGFTPATPSESPVLHPVVIRKPAGPPRIELAGMDPQGRSGSVACSTCHSVRKPDLANISAATLNEFHQGMTFNHGTIVCYSCHNPDDADSLRLADGTSVAYENVMTLCSQCHGSQATAFAHGAHGGMNGHWDLTRGPQMKNNCIDCHDPHAPNYPKMIVGFKPKDRFNTPAESDHGTTDHGTTGHGHSDRGHPQHDHSGAESHDDH
ncbi:hypothetical protein SAMN06265222_106278 [Neorhodopirellula lusitana]|uniref:Doubled CXXCH motif domain-containing protein n=1 Tax=Neorhodopirellula lusitana TaxID=445327 RepID=A0ABY1Q608_9BACT|nr:cytochrome c3 family protein [Neorhodopirellula lusitana]SMP59849.1 hypothetical protein SAMN06265222_106278 [Neorhodopirellula lusitana]